MHFVPNTEECQKSVSGFHFMTAALLLLYLLLFRNNLMILRSKLSQKYHSKILNSNLNVVNT